MARIKGLVDCSVNFEVKKTAPLDSRIVVDTVLELTETSTWVGSDGQAWLYDGLVVAVKETNGLYMLKGFENDPLAYTDIDNWVRQDAVAAKIDVVDNLASTDKNKALAASQGKVLADKIEEVKTSIATTYNYRGSVANFAALPSNAVNGDVYNVVAANGNVPAGTNYAWNGTEWDALGGSVDLSGYYTKEQVDSAIEDAKPSEELKAIKDSVQANSEALLVINGDSETSGSIANTLKVSKDYTDTQLTNYVEKVEGSSLITSEKLQLIDTNASDIAELQTQVEANTAVLTILQGDVNKEGSILNIVDNKISHALSWQNID